MRHDGVVQPTSPPLPPLAEAMAAHASESYSGGPSRQHLPTLRLPVADSADREKQTPFLPWGTSNKARGDKGLFRGSLLLSRECPGDGVGKGAAFPCFFTSGDPNGRGVRVNAIAVLVTECWFPPCYQDCLFIVVSLETPRRLDSLDIRQKWGNRQNILLVKCSCSLHHHQRALWCSSCMGMVCWQFVQRFVAHQAILVYILTFKILKVLWVVH